MGNQPPIRFPLLLDPQNRDETTLKDAKLVNGYVEAKGQERSWVYKRPGLVVSAAIAAGAGGGVFNWLGDVYAVVGGTLYKNGVSVGVGLDTSNGVYTFSSDSAAVPQIWMQNGVYAYKYDPTNGLVQDANLAATLAAIPDTMVKGNAFLDQSMYVLTKKGAAVYGSALNDLSTWLATTVILAQIEPGQGVFLAKQLSYVCAMKQYSVEIMYDAAAAGGLPGSQLALAQGLKVSVGCKSAGSVQIAEGSLFWIGQTEDGSVQVMLMDGMKAVPISTPAVERLLQDGDFTTVYSWTARISGHRFYGITLKNSNLTLVFDMTTRLWAQWTDPNGNYIPIVASANSSAGVSLLQHETNGKLYTLSVNAYADDGVIFPVDLYTPLWDGGNDKRKYAKKMNVIGDTAPGSILYIRVSDDDYNTWTPYRKMDMGQKDHYLMNCGTFRRRAIHLHHYSNTPMRIEAIEYQVEMGTL